MASMWPASLPAWVLDDPRRSSEVAVYRRLRDLLDSAWVVYYSRPWWGLARTGGEIDGEADFIIGHPERGFLFLEVKGGRISYDPSRERWSSIDRRGISHGIKDPAKQAMVCKHQFRRRLLQVPDWPGGRVRFRHAVALPDTVEPSPSTISLGGYERMLFCHASGFESGFGQWVESRLGDHGVDGIEIGPGEAGMECLRSLVAEPVCLRTALVRDVEAELDEMDRLLTGAQLHTLMTLESHPRAVVEGGAGTGKTVVATELAHRQGIAGRDVLLLCDSAALAGELQRQLSGTAAVMTLGRFLSMRRGPAAPTSAPMKWDTIVVDEAQDVDVLWWDAIEPALKPDGRLIAFADCNQAVYRLPDDLATRLDAITVALRLNLRNTQNIARVSDSLYKGPLIHACGPDGHVPVALEMSLPQARIVAAETVNRLRRDEQIPESMVAVLSSEPQLSRIRRELDLLDVASGPAGGHGRHRVVLDEAAKFKGLEAPVVVLVADEELSNSAELAYVAVTRARARLFVLGRINDTLLGNALPPQTTA